MYTMMHWHACGAEYTKDRGWYPTSKVLALCSNVCVRFGPNDPRAISSMWPALTIRCLCRWMSASWHKAGVSLSKRPRHQAILAGQHTARPATEEVMLCAPALLLQQVSDCGELSYLLDFKEAILTCNGESGQWDSTLVTAERTFVFTEIATDRPRRGCTRAIIMSEQ